MCTMKIQVKRMPKSPIIIEGFPGFGLIGTIVTEFLIEHLKAAMIGEFIYEELPATVAIHRGKLVRPMAIYHDSESNLVVLHTILNTRGYEWQIADAIIDFADKCSAKKIISVEGVGSMAEDTDTKLYGYGDPTLLKIGLEPVQESIIMGVSAAIMLRYKNVSCIFADTHSNLPDSKAAAKVIEALDKHLGLRVDTKPLLKQAAEFEEKLKTIMKQSNKTNDEIEKKNMSYLG